MRIACSDTVIVEFMSPVMTSSLHAISCVASVHILVRM
jgi:hypothetical protein